MSTPNLHDMRTRPPADPVSPMQPAAPETTLRPTYHVTFPSHIGMHVRRVSVGGARSEWFRKGAAWLACQDQGREPALNTKPSPLVGNSVLQVFRLPR